MGENQQKPDRGARQDVPREAGQAVGTPPESGPTRRTATVGLIAVLGVGLAVRLLHLWAISGTGWSRIGTVSSDSDMYANVQWAQRILAGDWLGRDTYHPSFEWMKAIAPQETWYRWWGGKEVFQQAPLYPYLLATMLGVCRGSVTGVLLVQLLLGAFQPLVIYRLATRVFDVRVALVAAGLTAVYGPLIFHQGVLLRDWLPPLLEPLALLALLKAREDGRGRTWCLAGACLGLAVLAKETILVFLPWVLLWILLDHRRVRRQAIRPVALVVLGLLISLSPLLLRNLTVGAPLFALSNRAAEGLIEGNAADGVPVGLQHPPSMGAILELSQGRLWAVVRETLGTYRGDWVWFVKLQLLKLRALMDPFEAPNNVSFAYGAELSPVLRFTLGYGLVLPLGLAGLLVLRRASWRHRLLAMYGLAIAAGLMTVPIMGRYRLVLVPVLILLAAALLVQLGAAIHRGAIRAAVGPLGLALALGAAQQTLVPIPDEMRPRIYEPEYLWTAHVYAEAKQFDRAAAEMGHLLDKARQSPPHAAYLSAYETDYRVYRARDLLGQGRREEARRQLDLAVAAYARTPDRVIAREYNFGLLYLRLGDLAQAKTFFTRVLELTPDGSLADQVRMLLSRIEGLRR